MIMCVLLCYPVSIHMSQLLSTGHPISSCIISFDSIYTSSKYFYRFITFEFTSSSHYFLLHLT